MKSPKVSIVTVCYNSAETIGETFESIRSQQYNNIEYIVIDGNSDDRTLELIKQNKDIIDSWISEEDSGLYYAMNKGIKKADGDIVGILNSDDKYFPYTVSDIVKEYNRASEPSVIYGNLVKFVDGSPKKLFEGDMTAKGFERMDIQINHPTCFVDKKLYKKYGTFDTAFETGADRELMIRLYKKDVKFRHVDKPLAMFRMGGVTTKFDVSKSIRVSYQQYQMYRRHDLLNIGTFTIISRSLFSNILKSFFHYILGADRLSKMRMYWARIKSFI